MLVIKDSSLWNEDTQGWEKKSRKLTRFSNQEQLNTACKYALKLL